MRWLEAMPLLAQDILIVIALLLPTLITGRCLLHGYAPWPLVRGLMWRFRWINMVFMALIGCSLAIGIGLTAQERALRIGTAQAANNFDLVVTARGSEVVMLLASVFLQPTNAPLLDGETFVRVASNPNVTMAAPLAFGDSYGSAPIVGTTQALVTHLAGGAMAEGRMFAISTEAVVGVNAPVQINDTFTPAHGRSFAANPAAHGDRLTVVGRMPPTGSPWDTAIIIPIEGVWQVHGLANGHPFSPDRDQQTIGPPFTPELFPGRLRLSCAAIASVPPMGCNQHSHATRKPWPSFRVQSLPISTASWAMSGSPCP